MTVAFWDAFRSIINRTGTIAIYDATKNTLMQVIAAEAART
ncbi:hypothetical protein [Natrinema sp. CGMCC1.2065]